MRGRGWLRAEMVDAVMLENDLEDELVALCRHAAQRCAIAPLAFGATEERILKGRDFLGGSCCGDADEARCLPLPYYGMDIFQNPLGPRMTSPNRSR